LDTTASGQQIKCLTVVDEYTHECLAIDVAESIRSRRAIGASSRVVSLHGALLFMGSDNRPTSSARPSWSLVLIAHAGIATVLNDPGEPRQSGTDESFNGKFRDGCLSIERFRSRRKAAVPDRSLSQSLYRGYVTTAPLQYLTPAECKLELRKELQPAVL